MKYFFYSEKENLKGLLAYNLYKKLLFKNLDDLLKNCKNKTSGYIYTVNQSSAKNINGGYKSNNPLEVIGCKNLSEYKDLL